MRKAVAQLASLAQLAFSATLVAVGAIGVVAPRWELPVLLGFDAEALSAEGSATMLNQHRYRASVELAAGVYALVARRAILTGGKEAAAFLILVALGCFARMVAWAADGPPSALFIGILAAEALTFLLVAAHLALSRTAA